MTVSEVVCRISYARMFVSCGPLGARLQSPFFGINVRSTYAATTAAAAAVSYRSHRLSRCHPVNVNVNVNVNTYGH